MNLKELLAFAEEAEQKEYQQLCREARQADVDRKKVTGGLQKLLRALLSKSGEDARSLGAFLGEFWKRFQPKKEKKEKEEELPSFKRLEGMAPQLPYPLGYRLQEFLGESEAFLAGRGSSNYAFLLASMNGLALRFHAIVAMCSYIHFLGAPDTVLNQELVEGLQVPADGTWKTFLDRLLQEALCQKHPWLALLREQLYTRRAFPGKKKGLAPLVAMQEMVTFRNHLLHGTHRFVKDELLEAMQKIQLIFGAMAFLCEARLFVKRGARWLSLQGLKGPSLLEKSPLDGEERYREKEPIFFLGEEKKKGDEKKEKVGSTQAGSLRSCSLYPLLAFVERSEKEAIENDLFFLNGMSEEKLEYISYKYPRSWEHRQLGISYADLLHFLKKIPAVRLQPKVRLDFFEMARVHLQAFVGREEQLAAILSFLEQRPQPYGIVYARGGMGKTALFSRLYHAYQREEKLWPSTTLALWHFCGPTDGRDHPVVFWRSILAQLDKQLDGQEGDYPTSLQQLQELWLLRMERITSEKRRVVLFVEGLDEGIPPGLPSLSIPASLPRPEEMPPSLTVVCSYRVDEHGKHNLVEELLPVSERLRFLIPGAAPLPGLSWAEMTTMLSMAAPQISTYPDTLSAIWKMATQQPLLSVQEGQDGAKRERQIRSSVAKRTLLLGRESSEKTDDAGSRAADGVYADPLLLRFLYEELEEGRTDPKRPESVPRSLQAIFDRLWNQLPSQDNYFLVRMLGMLAIMPDTGSDLFFSLVFGKDTKSQTDASLLLLPEEIARRRTPINKLLSFRKDRYSIFHRRFREYIQKRFHPRDMIESLHLPIYRYCCSTEGAYRRYDLQHRVHHLYHLSKSKDAALQKESKETMVSLLHEEGGYFEKKFSSLQRVELLQEDFLQILRVFRPSLGQGPKEAWRAFSTVYALCLHAHQRLNLAQKEGRQMMWRYAQEGKQEYILRGLLQEKSRYWRLLVGIQLCKRLAQAGHPFLQVWRFLVSLEPFSLQKADLDALARDLRPLPILEEEKRFFLERWHPFVSFDEVRRRAERQESEAISPKKDTDESP
ncbi:MAG: ATP-binding protein [Myxococcales bacterium]|nr:ATP-binding protein [Myxococcales bacterium]